MRPGLALVITCISLLIFVPIICEIFMKDFSLLVSYSIIGGWVLMIAIGHLFSRARRRDKDKKTAVKRNPKLDRGENKMIWKILLPLLLAGSYALIFVDNEIVYLIGKCAFYGSLFLGVYLTSVWIEREHPPEKIRKPSILPSFFDF